MGTKRVTSIINAYPKDCNNFLSQNLHQLIWELWLGILHALRNKSAHFLSCSNLLVEVPCSKSAWRSHQPCCWISPDKFCFLSAEFHTALIVLALLHSCRNEDDIPSPLCSLLLGSDRFLFTICSLFLSFSIFKSPKPPANTFVCLQIQIYAPEPSFSLPKWRSTGWITCFSDRMLFRIMSLRLPKLAFNHPVVMERGTEWLCKWWQ